MMNLLFKITLLIILNITTFTNKDNISIGLVSFILLTYLPGSIIFTFFKYNLKTIMEKISFYTGMGTIFIILLGLGINNLFPLVDIIRPLEMPQFMLAYNVSLIILMICSYVYHRNINKTYKMPKITFKTILFFLISSLIPFSAILGAISLNNNGTNIIALFTYFLIGIYSLLIFIFNNKLSTNKTSFSLYIISLVLLFMNSFRGWFNTGHDIQREFYVFSLTNSNKIWDMSLYRDPYNACLSLTILPTIYSSITHISDYFIFKILYQLIFSLTIVNIFSLLRRYISKSLAFIASLNFLFFPTFMTDMPMLGRQEFAFFFLSLMLFVHFENNISKIKKTILFIILSTGMILSHYSTSYVASMLFGFTYLSTIFVVIIHKFITKKIKIKKLNLHIEMKQRLNIIMIIFLIMFTIFWNSIYTNSSENINNTFSKIANNITRPFEEKQKTGEILYSIFSYKSVPPYSALEQYMLQTIKRIRHPKEDDAFFSKKIYSKYPIILDNQEILEPSIYLPTFIKNLINFDLVSKTRDSYAKIMQLFIIIGLISFTFYKKHKLKLPLEFYLLSIISLVLIVLQIVLPQSAIGYGILRFYQQSLMVFSIFIVLGFYWLLKAFFISSKFLRKMIIMIFMLFYFFLLSGFIPQLIGGYYPQLPLNNKGSYYSMYYTHKSDIATLEWLKPFANKINPIQSDAFDDAKIKTYAKSFPIAAVLPAVVKKNSYIYFNYPNVKFNRVLTYTNGGMVIYNYPIQFLEDNKNLIYSTSETAIYR